jgi:hypothetical protein
MGQRIVCARIKPTVLIFVDLDRGIDGQVPLVRSWYEGDGEYKTQQLAMAMYNYGNYNGVDSEHREALAKLMHWGNETIPGYKDPAFRRDSTICALIE